MPIIDINVFFINYYKKQKPSYLSYLFAKMQYQPNVISKL